MRRAGASVRVVDRASDCYSAHLQVGRWLKGPLLAVAVSLRNLALSVATVGLWWDLDHLAPAWVVVTQKDNGRVLGQLAAGRDAGAGEALLAAVLRDLEACEADAFLHRYGLVSSDM